MIQYDPNSLDAFDPLSMLIVEKLHAAGWKILLPMLPAVPRTPGARIRPGITIEGISDTSDCEVRDTPTCSLWQAFRASKLEPFQGTGGTEFATDLPEGALCIVVGPRPLLPPPPAQN